MSSNGDERNQDQPWTSHPACFLKAQVSRSSEIRTEAPFAARKTDEGWQQRLGPRETWWTSVHPPWPIRRKLGSSTGFTSYAWLLMFLSQGRQRAAPHTRKESFIVLFRTWRRPRDINARRR
ncbi:uncharacterized protein CIMG_06090 [Coccidioides immitis RS]|uniref:Uncharacterized protein n=1 Tax=Coccidioides immitis (strain RS) TaxID=246410 RepID=J3K7E0_COCIM|nr:uncharacterized protein CIMG_06090 [Coccidioides immitis RS]EAS30611.3 hypothetical protein CIMG_06090 [Coccidioides immitis RS]